MLLFKQLEDQYGYLSISKLHNKIKRGAFISLVMYILYSSLCDLSRTSYNNEFEVHSDLWLRRES